MVKRHHLCSVYMCVLCILYTPGCFIAGNQNSWNLGTINCETFFIHPSAGGSSDQICITNCAAKCGTWMGLEGPIHQTDLGRVELPTKTDHWVMEWIDYCKWIVFFFERYITLGGTHVVTSLLKSWIADFRICILHTLHIWHLHCVWHFAAGIVIWCGHDIDVFAILFSKHSIWSQLPTQFHPKRRFLVKLTKISFSLLHQSLFLFLTSKVGDFLLPLKGTKIEEQEHELQNLNSAIAAKVMGFPKKVTVVLLFRWLKRKTLSFRRFAELEDLLFSCYSFGGCKY